MTVMRSNPDLNRLYVALLLSSLLHAVLIFMPLLGMDGRTPAPPLAKASHLVTARLIPGESLDITPHDAGAHGTKTAERNEPQNHPEKQGLLSAPKQTFFSASQLTKHPRAIDQVDLNVPAAGLLTTSGTLVLNLWIDNLGNVVSIEVEKTELPEEFASAVAAVFSRVRFAPGEMYGRPVGSIMKVEISHENASPFPP